MLGLFSLYFQEVSTMTKVIAVGKCIRGKVIFTKIVEVGRHES